jgi:putative phosphotransacetylase
MSPQDAAYYGVRQGDVMKLRVGGDAGVTFERVHVRVGADYRLDVHLDTDEANACGLRYAKEIGLFK